MKPIPFAEINRELVPKDPLEATKYGTALAEKCRLGHNTEPQTPKGNRRRKSLWLPRIRTACAIRAQAMLSLPRPKSEHDIVFDRHKFLKTNDGKAIFHSIDEDKIFISSGLSIPKEIDPLEDFTTYTEYDPQSRFTVTTNQITAANVLRGDTGRIYRDYGSGYFQDFTHYLQVSIDSISGSGSNAVIATVYATTNNIGTMSDWWNQSAQCLKGGIAYDPSDGRNQLNLTNYETRVSDVSYIQLTTTYYLTIERSSTTAIVYIYTNAERSALFDTLTVALDSARNYRYIFATNCAGYNVPSPAMSFTVANLDLHPISFQPAWAEGINTHHF